MIELDVFYAAHMGNDLELVSQSCLFCILCITTTLNLSVDESLIRLEDLSNAYEKHKLCHFIFSFLFEMLRYWVLRLEAYQSRSEEA